MNDSVYVVKDSWKTPATCDNLWEMNGKSQGGSLTNPIAGAASNVGMSKIH